EGGVDDREIAHLPDKLETGKPRKVVGGEVGAGEINALIGEGRNVVRIDVEAGQLVVVPLDRRAIQAADDIQAPLGSRIIPADVAETDVMGAAGSFRVSEHGLKGLKI